jgi:hypothetical protein
VAYSAATPAARQSTAVYASVLPSSRLIDHSAASVPERPELDNRRATTRANGARLSRTELRNQPSSGRNAYTAADLRDR